MLLTIILLPILGSIFITPFNKLGVKPAVTAMLIGSAVFVLSVFQLTYAGTGAEVSWSLQMPFGFGPHFKLDMLAAFMAACSSFLSLIIIFYSTGYIHDKDYENEYYTMVILFLGSMMGLVFSFNLVWTFVFWELTAICSWRLVGFFRGDTDKKKAVKTFLITVFGALFLLLGIAALYFTNGTVDLTLLKGSRVPLIVCALLVAGMFSKSAILPFSTWLPDAGVAPSPVTALLHAAVLVKIGVYVFARVFYTVNLDPSLGHAVALIAGVSSLIAGGAAVTETNIKRIIAYSTISQLGFIFLALSTRTALGLVAGMLFIMMHGAAKGGLFLCAGIIEHKTHTKDITKMGGLFKVMPLTGLVFAICALSVMGIPPMGGFFSKFMVFKSASAAGGVLVFAIFILAACFTAAYLLRVFHIVFLGSPGVEWEMGPEGSKQTLISVSILAVLTVVMSVFVALPVNYLIKAAVQMGVL
ncbi:Putative Ech hydrogenase component [Elusimicrobium minutum Pei191]|uniref:Putative Ech hydrogenase component n=1 Tax=Elusimicrobium minutum (strain Pei191) TaxID=445932 RepID=B2KDU4_ELUMP|nr:NADH-quinone oxidoreductase subunit L [Elusimicrobium minutum]ACC98690.1 Putative Ech hydrogenase component [Elusimicrobium minutum Pei191]